MPDYTIDGYRRAVPGAFHVSQDGPHSMITNNSITWQKRFSRANAYGTPRPGSTNPAGIHTHNLTSLDHVLNGGTATTLATKLYRSVALLHVVTP